MKRWIEVFCLSDGDILLTLGSINGDIFLEDSPLSMVNKIILIVGDSWVASLSVIWMSYLIVTYMQ